MSTNVTDALIQTEEVSPAGVKMTAKELLARLRRHYIKPGPYPGGIFIPECGINGPGDQSRADALYVGLTSTSGRLLVGHELKVSRSDWLKELDTAGKADFWADNCHAWYVVAPGPQVAPKEEIPEGWGLMYPNPRTTTRMQVIVKAPVHADRTPSWQAMRSIMGRVDTLNTQAAAQVHSEALDDARKQAREEQERRNRADGRLTTAERERLDMLTRLEQFVGGPVKGYVIDGEDGVDVRQLAAALRLVGAADRMGLRRADQWAVTSLREAAESMLAGLEAFGEARAAVTSLLEVARG